MADEMQRSPSREAASSAKQKNRLPYSPKSFERVAHLVGADWVAHHADLEDQLTEAQVVPDTTAIISASLDRVSVPMEEGTATFHRWKSLLRKRNSSVDEILRELRTSGCEWKCRDNKQPVHEAITYLENHRDRMFYASARRQHLPIGSGSAEATCKTLVTMRMKRPGAHWKEQTGEQILKLRALACSDRWDAGMDLLHAQRRTAVRAAA
jgi:hypothetical protein